jgi:hypothetical protein
MFFPIFNGSSPYPAMGALPHDIQFILGLIFFITPAITIFAFFAITDYSQKWNLFLWSVVHGIGVLALFLTGIFDDASAPPIWVIPIVDAIISVLIMRWAHKKGVI